MKRFPRLNRIIQTVVAAAMPLAAAGCCAGYQDPSEARVVAIDRQDEDLSALIAACEADDLACEELCRTIVRKLGVDRPDELYFTECRLIEVTEVTDGIDGIDEGGDGTGAGEPRLHMTFAWPEGCVSGRPPAGLAPCPEPDARGAARGAVAVVGAFLARMAYLEAASVYEFRTLARELAGFGAPGELVRRARAAAREEVGHARLIGALARRWGARAPRPARPEAPARGLERLCADNAVDGCVRETYSAAVAAWQARAAGDPAIRAVMARVAREEAGHAQLSADIRAWGNARLPGPAARRVEDARRRAVAELAESAAAELPRALVAIAGLPAPASAAALVRGMRASVWGA